MAEAQFRFYAELNDFLRPEYRYTAFGVSFLDISPVKDRIESLGVPHTEVDLILVNGDPADFTYRVQNGDRVSVYPVFEAFDIAGLTRLRPEPLRVPRFVLDIHLGKLAAYLRMLGFDALYRNDYRDDELARISRDERRLLLTRDTGLLKRAAVTHGYFLRNTESRRQLAETLERFDLTRLVHPFSRCMRCNGLLENVSPSEAGPLPGRVAEQYSEFRRCQGCGRIYWKGGHYRRMVQWIDNGCCPAAQPPVAGEAISPVPRRLS